jgi:hypothetical protein
MSSAMFADGVAAGFRRVEEELVVLVDPQVLVAADVFESCMGPIALGVSARKPTTGGGP